MVMRMQPKKVALGIEVDGELEDYEITNNVFEKLMSPSHRAYFCYTYTERTLPTS